LFVLAYILVS
jgi:nickel/cobalt exporter